MINAFADFTLLIRPQLFGIHFNKKIVVPVLRLALLMYSCQKDRSNLIAEVIPQEVIDQLSHLGLNPDGIERVEDGYLIERDIIITDEFLQTNPDRHFVPNKEQHRTQNVVETNGARVITIYASTGEKKGFSAGMIKGLELAMARFNAENLDISFQSAISSSKSSNFTLFYRSQSLYALQFKYYVVIELGVIEILKNM